MPREVTCGVTKLLAVVVAERNNQVEMEYDGLLLYSMGRHQPELGCSLVG